MRKKETLRKCACGRQVRGKANMNRHRKACKRGWAYARVECDVCGLSLRPSQVASHKASRHGPPSPSDLRFKALYEAGWSGEEVATIVGGVTSSGVYASLRRNGVKLRPRGQKGYQRLTDEQIAETVRLYVEEDLTQAEVALRLGLSQRSVTYRLRLAGVELRSRGEATRIGWERTRRPALAA